MTEHEDRPDAGGNAKADIRWEDFASLWSRATVAAGAGGRRRKANAAIALWCVALFVAFLTWNGAAGRTSVGEQVPYLVSGGLASLVLTFAGSVLFLIGVLEAARGQAGGEPGEAR